MNVAAPAPAPENDRPLESEPKESMVSIATLRGSALLWTEKLSEEIVLSSLFTGAGAATFTIDDERLTIHGDREPLTLRQV